MIRSIDQFHHQASFACNSFHASYNFTTFHAGILFNFASLGVNRELTNRRRWHDAAVGLRDMYSTHACLAS